VIGHLNGDQDKANLYTRLINDSIPAEGQWISLIQEVGKIVPDFEKSNLLVQIAQKMPKTGDTKSAYLKAAKTITNDSDYGRVMRGVE
jgi:hypothetical protein